ncbi:stage II sporulation protein P [Clostridium celatum]|uniref:stage II sporulation protein P n=1 Tax=Clostridium celatum TaxID=36834 RepID=UPI00189B2FEB|nr:stage II sporulation protein P [Clostridium celatum]
MQWVNGDNKNTKKKKQFSVGYILLILIIVVVIVRAVGIINNYRERGGLAYVQLINYSMPIVETQIYDESAYRENTVDLKRVLVEALGLNNITTYGIIGNEIAYFKNPLKETVTVSNNTNSRFNIFTPYEVKEESIVRMTDEDIAELNSVSAAYDPSLKKTLDPNNVEVLIYHTHTHEGYIDVGADSSEEDFTVVGVGNVLAQELQEGYGISVIHDKTIHDIAPYADSYFRSQVTVESYLEQFPNLKLIIDLHRDGGPDKDRTTTEINGQSLARVEFVTSQTSPYYNEMMETVNSLITIADTLFPTFLRDEKLMEYPSGSNDFNQNLSPACILTEFGADKNTAQESKLSAKYLARIIAEYLNR